MIVQGVSSGITKTMTILKTKHDHRGRLYALQAVQGLPKHNEVERQRCVHATQLHTSYIPILAKSHQPSLPFDSRQHKTLEHQNMGLCVGQEIFQRPACEEHTAGVRMWESWA